VTEEDVDRGYDALLDAWEATREAEVAKGLRSSVEPGDDTR
jgi:hypothetical protein